MVQVTSGPLDCSQPLRWVDGNMRKISPNASLLEMMKNIRGWETETLIVVNGKELNLPPNRSVIKAAGVVKPV